MTEEKTPEEEISDKVAEKYFGVSADPAERRSTIHGLLVSALLCVVLIPGLFYIRFGVVDGFAWGVTIFFVGYCLLAAVGLYFGPRREFHTPVRLIGDWLDMLGAFWLVACVFGPFFGWVLTSALPITEASWRWLYGLRFTLGGVLPLVTALPLTRYLRGKATLVGLPILLVVTLLAFLSVANVGRDLWAGPVIHQLQSGGKSELILQYTRQILSVLQ